MTAQIVSLVIVGIIVFYYLRKEHMKEKEYFGKPKTYGKKEQKILAYYKKIYKQVPNDERLPSIEKDNFELEDIAKTAIEIIYTEPQPNQEQIDLLIKGDMVKLKFVDEKGEIERMWVEYLENTGKIHKGILRNDSLDNATLAEGKEIFFHSNHIFQIDKE